MPLKELRNASIHPSCGAVCRCSACDRTCRLLQFGKLVGRLIRELARRFVGKLPGGFDRAADQQFRTLDGHERQSR
jgi:hypothetical protein